MAGHTSRRTALLISLGLLSAALVPLGALRIYYAGAGSKPALPAAVMAQSTPEEPSAARVAPAARSTQRRATRARVAPKTPSSAGFIWPLARGRAVTSPFGPRDDGFHHGVDLGCALGEPVYSARAGHVRYSAEARTYGNVVLIDHGGGWQTVYAHFDRLDVTVGRYVGTGEMLGTCGMTGKATGTHLHFEIRTGGYVYDPLHYLP